MAAGLLRVRDTLRKKVEAEKNEKGSERRQRKNSGKSAKQLYFGNVEPKIDSPDGTEEDAALLPISQIPHNQKWEQSAGTQHRDCDRGERWAKQPGPSRQN